MMKAWLNEVERITFKNSVLATTVIIQTTIILALITVVYSMNSSINEKLDNKEYIVVPGAPSMITVKKGSLESSYIEETYLAAARYLQQWTYKNINTRYDELIERLLMPEVAQLLRENIESTNLYNEVKKRKLTSYWFYTPKKSEFSWCGKIQFRNGVAGASCGIITGIRELYADHTIYSGEQEVSYLIYAINIAPKENNYNLLRVVRIIRGDYGVLKSQLDKSMKDGVLPANGQML